MLLFGFERDTDGEPAGELEVGRRAGRRSGGRTDVQRMGVTLEDGRSPAVWTEAREEGRSSGGRTRARKDGREPGRTDEPGRMDGSRIWDRTRGVDTSRSSERSSRCRERIREMSRGFGRRREGWDEVRGVRGGERRAEEVREARVFLDV